ADDYLIKPFSARELLARVSSRLELTRLRARFDEERAVLLVRERESREEAETLNQIARALAGELDLQKLVQSVTDASVRLTGAKFGAFFYNVVNEQADMLYTLSGAPREAFEEFGIPLNTSLFERTFRGTGVVRSDDILRRPDLSKNPPHYGMPRGHLPVRSYLAVPVASRSGEVLGGMFFGHPEPGVFTERAERIAVGIAGQAAVAIDNARLFAEAEKEIAGRKQAEAMTDQMAAIVKSSDDAILSKDLNGIIASWNKGAEKLFGYTAAEVIGKPVTILIPPDRVDEEPYILERIRRGEQIEHYETVRRRKDGSEIYISLTVSPVRDKSGKVIGASKIARDVTGRKRAEAALRESEERFRTLANNAPVMIWVNGPTGCEFVNRECLEFLGVGEVDVFGYDWAQFIHPKDREAYVNAYLEAVSHCGRFEAEFRFRRRDGEYRWMRSVGVPRIEGGECKGYVGISSDIHENRRAEETVRAAYEQESAARAEAEAANRSKDEFLAVVSHELRSPINAINGWVKLLIEGQLDPDDVDKALMVIERNSLAQTRLVEDLLDTARIVTGKLRLELGPLDINPILADALDVARESAAAKGVEVRASYSPRPMVVTGDATRLQQIVWNLLSNAIKFT
ncbi:MAG TPA: PAS domain S-box protein, partial [Blastocatellia bacterium]|nr:PAS domain S-box protein [Blastocatellia bacterium]